MIEFKQTVIPLTLFTFGFLVFIIMLLLVYTYFKKRLSINAVKKIIKENKELSPAQIQAIISPQSPLSDARKGILGITLALGFILFALIMGARGYDLAQSSLLGMSMFPLMIGLTYIYFHFIENKRQ